MKKRILFLLAALLLLSGCGGRDEPSERETAAETYSFQDGRYAASYADRNDDSAGQNGMSSAQTELMELFPEYFGLDASKGLDVIVWQMAPSDYSFGLLEHSETQREWVSKELMDLKGVSAEQMREILATYAVSEDAVYIVPWQNPISSYLPAYCINYGSEDMDAKKEAYAAEIRRMLFG